MISQCFYIERDKRLTLAKFLKNRLGIWHDPGHDLDRATIAPKSSDSINFYKSHDKYVKKKSSESRRHFDFYDPYIDMDEFRIFDDYTNSVTDMLLKIRFKPLRRSYFLISK